MQQTTFPDDFNKYNSIQIKISIVIAFLFFLLLYLPTASAEGQKTTLDIAKGSITIGNGTVSGKTPAGVTATFNSNGYLITSSSSSDLLNTITINGGSNEIVLQNVKISSGYNSSSPLSIENSGTRALVLLSGTNSLVSGNPKKAALGVAEGTELTIGTIDGTDNHTLNATSYGGNASAIGGNENGAAGKITINNGTVNAKFARSGNYGAAIGGGQNGAGGRIVINGGIVAAESYGGYAAAIGGGFSTAGYGVQSTTVTINGGAVTTKIPNASAYDSVGYGKVGASYSAAVQASTTVVINGGTLVNRNDSNNITPLLYKRQATNVLGEKLYSVGVKFDDAPVNGTAVEVSYDGQRIEVKTINGGYVYLFLPAGSHDVVATRLDTGTTYYGILNVSESAVDNPNSVGTISRSIRTVPVISVSNPDPTDADLNEGKTSVLVVTNLNEVVNGGGYPLQAGVDYTVQWYKGSTPIVGDVVDETHVQVTPNKGDTFKAKFVATGTGKVVGSSSFSAVKTALGPKETGVPVPAIASKLIVTSEAEFTKQPDPVAGAITYSIQLASDDGLNTPIEGVNVRIYQDGFLYTRVTGTGANAGNIQFTYSALSPGKHSFKVAFDGGKVAGKSYSSASYLHEFTVIKPEKPSGFTTIAAKSGTKNGKIFGTDESQEFIEWIPQIGNNQQINPVTGNVIENVGPSLYSIRYKAWYDGYVYSLASDYRYLVWVQTAQWTVTPVATDSVLWETGAVDVVAGGSAQFLVVPNEGYVIKDGDIKVKYANFSYDSGTHILSLDTITSNIQLTINASKIE